MRQGRLYVISGPTAVGKGTLCKEILKDSDDFVLSISATTRKIRSNEKEGISYYFKSKEEFEDMITRQMFLEYAKVHDQYYGTPKSFVENMRKEGKNILLEIDTQGGLQVKKNDSEAILIFIAPPNLETLVERIHRRGTETEEEVQKRLKNAALEFSNMDKYDYMVINDDLATAKNELKNIFCAEKLRIKNNIDLVEEFSERTKYYD